MDSNWGGPKTVEGCVRVWWSQVGSRCLEWNTVEWSVAVGQLIGMGL